MSLDELFVNVQENFKKKLNNLNKAQKNHAQEQVQVAANGAELTLLAELHLLVYFRLGQRVVRDE